MRYSSAKSYITAGIICILLVLGMCQNIHSIDSCFLYGENAATEGALSSHNRISSLLQSAIRGLDQQAATITRENRSEALQRMTDSRRVLFTFDLALSILSQIQILSSFLVLLSFILCLCPFSVIITQYIHRTDGEKPLSF